MKERAAKSCGSAARRTSLTAAPVYAFFGLIDRLYQYYRFGSFFNTYVSVVAREARQRDPSLPITYPFEKPFHEGFFGALFAPEKSIFLFDPLLILMIVLTVVAWKRFSPAVKAYVITGFCCCWPTSASTRATRCGAATSPGATAMSRPASNWRRCWRFRCCCAIAEQMAALVWIAGIALLAISTVIQIASLCFWLPLEIYQMETLGHPTFVIALRFKNIAGFALGRMYDNYRHALGPMGLRPHHDLELPAIPAEAGRGRPGMGSTSRVCTVDCRAGGNCGRPVEIENSSSPK